MSTSFAKGTISLSLATIFFFAIGYVTQILIGRLLSPEDFGTFGIVLYLLNTAEYIFTSGISQSTSKFLAERPNSGRALLRLTIWTQVIVGVIFMILLLALAPQFAKWYHDAGVAPLLRILVWMIPFYSARSLIQGILGGQQHFIGQSKTKIWIGVSKFVLIVLALVISRDVTSILIAYLLSALFGAVYGKGFIQPIRGDAPIPLKEFLGYTISLTAFLVVFPLFINIDVFLVRGLIQSTTETGWYVAATTMARLPFYLFTGLLLTLLPSVAHLKQTSEKELRRVVSEVIRYALVLLVPMSVLVAVTAPTLLPLLFGDEYRNGVAPLQLLVIGITLLVLFRVYSTVLLGLSNSRDVILVTFGMIVLDTVLNLLLIPRYGLLGAAGGSLIASVAGFAVIAVLMSRHLTLLLPLKSVGKIVLASLIAGGVSYFTNDGLLYVIEMLGIVGFYLLLLWVFKEIQPKDIQRFTRLLQRNEQSESL